MEFIAAWLGELDDELKTAAQELTDAVESHRAAELARDIANAEHTAQRAALDALKRPLSRALADRLRWAAQRLHELDGAAESAKVRVASARRTISDLHEAVEQLKTVVVHHNTGVDTEAPVIKNAAVSVLAE